MFRFEEHFNQDLVTLGPIMLLKYWQSTLMKTNTMYWGT